MEAAENKRFNVVDWIILALVAAAVTAAAFRFLVPEKPMGTIAAVEVVVKEQPVTFAAAILPGDLLYNRGYKRGKQPIARVEKILEVKPTQTVNTSESGQMVVSENPLRQDVVLRIQFEKPVQVFPSKSVYPGSMLHLDLTLGEKFWLNNYKYKMFGYILSQEFQARE